MDKIRAGVKTSEFWVTVVSAFLMIFNKGLGFDLPEEIILPLAGTVAAYVLGRSIAKRGQTNGLKILAFLLAAGLVLSTVACANFERNTYRTLAAAATTYETGMAAFADLDKRGLVGGPEKKKVMEIAVIYWSAYHQAVIAFEVWKKTDSAEAENQIYAALAALSQASAELLQYIQPILVREVEK